MVLILGGIVKSLQKGFKKAKTTLRQVLPVATPLAAGAAAIIGGPAAAKQTLTTLTGVQELVADRQQRQRGIPASRRTTRVPFAPLGAITRFATRTARTPIVRKPPTRAAIGRIPPPAAAPRPVLPITRRIPTVPPLRRVSAVRAAPRAAALTAPRLPTRPAGLVVPNLAELLAGAQRPGMIPRPPMDVVPVSQTVDKFGRPLVVQAGQEVRVRCPPGYLAITLPSGERACALAGPAIAAGLARRRRKPLISVKETRALQMAGRAQKKIDRVHKRFGTKPRMRRRTSK